MTDRRQELAEMAYQKLKALNAIFDDPLTKGDERRKVATVMAKLLVTYFNLTSGQDESGELDLNELKKKIQSVQV